MRRHDRHGLGLRARVTVAFGIGALALSALLAVVTYEIARNYLTDQRESSAQRQAYVNARLVAEGLRPSSAEIPALLASLETPADSQSLVHVGGEWYTTSVVVGPRQLPLDLRLTVISGTPAVQRFTAGGEPMFVVGVPIASLHGAYFEVFTLNELASTLDVLAVALLVAAVVTTASGAGLGVWASGRVLRPVRAISATASEIAQGRLDTRLPPEPDHDLATVADSFNSMVDALQERMERDARFASDVSHELRSPLTTLSTVSSVLEARSAEWDASSQEAVALLVRELRRFERLVQDLLEMARADAGRSDAELEDVRLGELVLHAVSRTDAGVPVELDAGADDLVVRVDKRRVERIVANILANAREHAGGATRVRVRESGEGVRIEVEDAGPGIPEPDRLRVFERFARAAAASREGGGSGLGLALVTEHVRLHGGSVWVEDAGGGGGARFVVELPRGPA